MICRTFARGGILNLVGGVSLAISNFVLLLALTRGLGASEAGGFITAMAMFNILAIVATAGVDTGLIRTISQWRAWDRRLSMRRILLVGLLPVFVVGSVLAIVTALGAETAAAWFGKPGETSVASYLRTLAPFIPVAGLLLATLGATRGFQTMLPTNVVNRMGKVALQVLFVWLAIVLGASAVGLAYSWAIPILAAFAASFYWLIRLERLDRVGTNRSEPDIGLVQMISDFWRFTLPRSVASILRVAMQWLDVILVGAIMTPRDAAIYAVTTRLLQFGLIVANSIGQAAQPMFSNLLAANDEQGTRSLYQTATGWQMVMTWPPYLAIACFAAALLAFFGVEFPEGAAAATILALAALVASGLGPVDMLLLMAGKSTWSLLNTVAALSTNVVLLVVLVPRLGLEGAALAWAAGRIIGNVLPFLEVAAYLKIHPFGRGWKSAATSAVLAFGVLGVAMRIMFGASPMVLLIYGLIAVTLYLALLYRYRQNLDLGVAQSVLRKHRSSGEATAQKDS